MGGGKRGCGFWGGGWGLRLGFRGFGLLRGWGKVGKGGLNFFFFGMEGYTNGVGERILIQPSGVLIFDIGSNFFLLGMYMMVCKESLI